MRSARGWACGPLLNGFHSLSLTCPARNGLPNVVPACSLRLVPWGCPAKAWRSPGFRLRLHAQSCVCAGVVCSPCVGDPLPPRCAAVAPFLFVGQSEPRTVITVTDPQRHGDGMSAYTSYTITTRVRGGRGESAGPALRLAVGRLSMSPLGRWGFVRPLCMQRRAPRFRDTCVKPRRALMLFAALVLFICGWRYHACSVLRAPLWLGCCLLPCARAQTLALPIVRVSPTCAPYGTRALHSTVHVAPRGCCEKCGAPPRPAWGCARFWGAGCGSFCPGAGWGFAQPPPPPPFPHTHNARLRPSRFRKGAEMKALCTLACTCRCGFCRLPNPVTRSPTDLGAGVWRRLIYCHSSVQ
jgi:hypothetical protein